MNANDKFLGYTIGLNCFVENRIKLVKVEYAMTKRGHVKLSLVSGHSLELIPYIWDVLITMEEYQGRPTDKAEQAIWALNKIGMKPAALECA